MGKPIVTVIVGADLTVNQVDLWGDVSKASV